MTFAVLRALHTIIGDALNEIEGVYSAHGQSLDVIPAEEIAEVSLTEATTLVSSPLSSPETRGTDSHSRPRHKPALSNGTSYAYVSPPPSPCISSPTERIPPPQDHQSGSRTPSLDFPSLDTPCDPNSLSEALTAHPTVITAINRVVAAAGQISATVQTPFLSLCDASMGYHLPSCMRILEASHIAEILREAGPPGLHIKSISEQSGIEASKLAHILRLLATHHILREVTPDVFAINRISSLIDSGKSARELSEFQASGRPELKYEHTNGIAAFVGLCADEIQKASAYMTETYLLSPSKQTREGREPTRAPFCFAFSTLESRTDFFGWLEGKADLTLQEVSKGNDDAGVETGPGTAYPAVLGSKAAPAARLPHPQRKKPGSVTISEPLKKSSPEVEARNPNQFRLERFGKAMSGTGSWEAPGAVLSGFDWHLLPKGSIVVDVGGGIGSTSMLLASAFSSAESGLGLKFVIQDRPVVVEMGEKAWKAKSPEFLDSGTAVFQVHDFFTPQPIRDAAVFLLRVVLHDWPDDFARRILLNLREAATPETKLLIADFVLPLACADNSGGLEGVEGAESVLAAGPLLPNLGKASANAYWMDLTMQVMFNSQERTLREIVILASSAGWKVVKVTKAPGSLFGHITAVPTNIPIQQKRARAGSGSAFFEAASASAAKSNDGKIVEDDEEERRYRGEMEIIERASSRCGTPTFGSRMELSSVEEALTRFGGGVVRPRGPGPIGKGGPSSLSPPFHGRFGGLKPPVALTSSVGRKKKPSPLSVPPQLSASPLPRSLASPRQQTPIPGAPPATIRRRMSHAQLSSSSRTTTTSPLPPTPTTPRQPAPISPLSPAGPPPPAPPTRLLARRASHAQLSSSYFPLSPSPSLIPTSSIRATPESPATHRSSNVHLPPSSLATQRQPTITRRSSYAQLPVQGSLRKRSGSVIGFPPPPMPGHSQRGIGLGVGMGSLLGGGSAGGVLRFEREGGRGSAVTTPDGSPGGGTSKSAVHAGAGTSVLAAAARIERGLFSSTPSP